MTDHFMAAVNAQLKTSPASLLLKVFAGGTLAGLTTITTAPIITDDAVRMTGGWVVLMLSMRVLFPSSVGGVPMARQLAALIAGMAVCYGLLWLFIAVVP